MRQYRIGIVGQKMIAHIHAAAIAATANAKLVGIMDRSSERAAHIAPDIDHRFSDDLHRFVTRDDIDVIMLATPSGAHADAALLTAQHGTANIVRLNSQWR